MALSMSGNIQGTSLTDVLEGLKAMRATGALMIQAGPAPKTLYFENGKIIFAASTDVNDRLGEVMVRAGKLARKNLESALQISKRVAGFKKLGAILVENGFVKPADLFAGLKLQVREIIGSLLVLKEGAYRFEPGLPTDIIPLQIDLQELLRETARGPKKK